MNPTAIEPSFDAKHVYYLSSPYTHADASVMEARYDRILVVAAMLIARHACTLIEPIGMSHEKAKRFSLPTTYTFWRRMNENWIRKCDGVIVTVMDGWRESRGVQDEIAFARGLGLPVYYLDSTGQCGFMDEPSS